MAIANPAQNTNYCSGTSGAIIEYQTPDRDVLEEDYEWEGEEFTQSQMPFQYGLSEALGALVETVIIAHSSEESTLTTLEKNKYYTFVATGVLPTGFDSIDACFFIDSSEGTTEPSDRLTTDDEQFDDMFFKAAENGSGNNGVDYDGINHEYSVGYIGNDATVTFSLGLADSGLLQIDIYENEYTITATKEGETEESEPTVLFSETRDKPYLNVNIACGGSCPTRTSFACECNGDRSCYYDDNEGTVTKIFEGTENP